MNTVGARFNIPIVICLLAISWSAPALAQISDDFSAVSFNDTLWTTVDPVGDATFNQSDGRLIISLPAGTNHDLWISGNNSARIMQAVADTNFEIEAKFESAPTAPYQIQGLLVEEDSQNYIRFDYFHDGQSLRIYATGFSGGQPTNYGNSSVVGGDQAYLRLKRTAAQWEAQYSTDGTLWLPVFTFNHQLTVASTGVFAGNLGDPAPAFDAIVDYFFNTASPVVPEDGGQLDITPPAISGIVVTPTVTSAHIEFGTDEPALGRVSYGLTSALELGTLVRTGYAINHSFDISGLDPATAYYIQVEAEDTSTNLSQGAVAQFTTVALANELPNVALTSPLAGASFALGDTIVLAATASDTDGTVDQVEFLADGIVLGTALASPWEFGWAGAQLGHHGLVARAIDNSGGVTTSDSVRVTVNQPAGVFVVTSDDFSAASLNDSLWTFVDPLGDSSISQANGLLTISLPGGVAHDAWSNGNEAARLMQPVPDTNIQVEAKLESALLQPYQIQGILAAQDSTSFIRLDYYSDGVNLHVFGAAITNNVPVTLANIIVPSGGLLWLRLTRTGDQWLAEHSGDGANWAQVFDYGSVMTLTSVGVFAGNAGNPVPSFEAVFDYFFDTNDPIVPEDGSIVDTQPPVISGVVVAPGVTSATISFATDELALGRVYYGLTTGLELGIVSGSGFLTSHAVVLPGLTAETPYYYQIEAEDSSHNLVQEPIAQLTTLAVPNALPVVTLTTPVTGTHYAVGDTIFMAATATDSDGTVSTVEFLSGTTVVGTTSSAPWEFAWSGAVAGNHNLTARATDNNGGVSSSVPATITVDPDPGTAIAISDDFSGFSLADSVWTFVDPVGDCTAYQAYGVLNLSVPGGVEHNLWTAGNDAARVVQSVADADLGLEVKFETEPTSRYQIQGLLLEESPGNYIRVDFFHDGSSLRLFAASFVANAATVRGNIVVPSGSPLWVRANRVGDSFSVDWSADGNIWQAAFSFNHTFILQTVGVYAGNSGSPAPAFDAVVDYFFDQLAPINPEDNNLTDIWPPLVSNINVVSDPSTSSAVVSCTTNEPATTMLSFGVDTNYGTDIIGTTSDGLNHQFMLGGLVPNGAYHFSIVATDTLGNTGASPDQQFLNVEVKPVITVWGGLNQRVGHLGVAQADFNLVGNVFLWETLSTLTFRVNGALEQPLNWGQGAGGFGDGRRLAKNGDFNVDLPLTQLQMGPNTITVHAVDVYGKEDIVTATVTRESGTSTLPTFINWDTVTNPQDVGQTVDGSWTHDSTGLRTVSIGYDRIFLLGEETWQDYEIVCPITINKVESSTSLQSGYPGIGFLMRFTGHIEGGYRNWPTAQPKWGYQPFGGLGWLRYLGGAANPPTVQFYHGDVDVADNYGATKNGPAFDPSADPTNVPFGDPSEVTNFGTVNMVQIGVTFWMKMRCETLPDAANGYGVTQYSYKVWQDGEVEPAGWAFQYIQQSQYALRQGSVCLLAHNVDVTFGDVGVVEISGAASVGGELPRTVALADNYPNPFNPATRIAFDLPEDSRARLTVFDIRGRFVTTLLDENLAPGRHTVVWRGTDEAGQEVSSGQYFYRLDAGGVTAVKKMLLLK